MITRRPYSRIAPRLYRFGDNGQYFVRVAGWTPAGMRVDEKVELPVGTSYGQALVARDEMLAQVKAGTWRTGSTVRTTPPTLRDVLEAIDRRERDRWSPNTRRGAHYAWKRMAPLLDMQVRAIRYEPDIRLWLAELAARYEPKTIRNTVGHLGRALRFAHAMGWSPGNEALLIRVQRHEQPAVIELPEPEQLAPAFRRWRELDDDAAAAGRYVGWETFFGLQLWGGFRVGEVQHMQREWVDHAQLVIRLPAAATKGRRARHVPISPEWSEKILRHIVRLQLCASAAAAKSSMLFPSSHDGAEMSRSRVESYFADGIRAAGLDAGRESGHTTHMLRRMAISRMMRAGVREAVVRAIVGHRNPFMLVLYDRPFQGELDEAREALAAGHNGRRAGDSAGDTKPTRTATMRRNRR